MRPGTALLLLSLGLGPGLGRLPPATPPRGARAATPEAPRGPLRGALPGLGVLGGRARLSLRPRAAPDGGGVLLSGGRSLCCSRGGGARAGGGRRGARRPPGPARPRCHCLRVHGELRARGGLRRPAAPTDVAVHLSAPRGRLSLLWAALLRRRLRPRHGSFHLRLRGPGETRPPRPAAVRLAARSVLPLGPHPSAGVVAGTSCPTGGPRPVTPDAFSPHTPEALGSSVSCQLRPCRINQVKVDKDKTLSHVRVPRGTETTLTATVDVDCPNALAIHQYWQVFSVSSLSEKPDWTNPLDVPQLQTKKNSSSLHVPKASLPLGIYVFNFIVSITPSDPQMPVVKVSDYIYVEVFRSPLNAVILGDSNITMNFTDGLVLNGTMSSDPDADNPLEGLNFFWYCTTNSRNYGKDNITVMSQEVCHPEQTNLRWTWASGPVLTLLPETLQGHRVYFFRMLIQKSDRKAFADRRVQVLQGPAPSAKISCIENCNSFLVTSDRFSLFLNCTNCATSRVFYKWSVLSPSNHEIVVNWTQHTTTGRNGAYVSVKAFTFRKFYEVRLKMSVHLATWGGVNLYFRYPFIINQVPKIGECKIDPAKGIAIYTKFVVRCNNFTDRNVPLMYKIIVSNLHSASEISSVKENTLGATLYLGTESTAPPSFLPVGLLASHYAVKIYVQVYDSLGGFSQVTLYATVQSPTDQNSPRTVLHKLHNLTMGPNSLLSTLLQQQEFLPAGYLIYTVASVLNNMKTESSLQADKANLREHLVNQSFNLPATTLVEINQVVMTLTELSQKGSEFTQVAEKRILMRLRQANQALQMYQQRDASFRSEQIEIVSTGIATSLSNILNMTSHREAVQHPFDILESLGDTFLLCKVPGNETTVVRTPNFNMYLNKIEKWDVTEAFKNETHCRNCFYPKLNISSAPDLPANAPVSTMICEFANDPFPWLNYGQNISTEVVGFRMTGVKANGDVMEITPDAVEVHLVRKNLTFAAFNLTVGPSDEHDDVDEPLKRTTGAFHFEVDSGAVREVLVHIVTEVTVLFQVLVYAGGHVTPAALVATFLVPHDMPPTANQSGLFNPACAVKQARVVCLPQSLLQVIAQRSNSSRCVISVVLRAPHFVMEPNDKLVRISLFSVQCLDMYGIQSEWREDHCILGEQTSWDRVHCICKDTARARRQLDPADRSSLQVHMHFLTAEVIVLPNHVDLQFEVIRNIHQNPVTLLTVFFIMLMYIVLAFWALHKDETDQFLREHVILPPDNDPYDTTCYLVTIFTGSRCGSGTRANVFIQLMGTESTSDVHCISHPYYRTLYRGSINTFLLTAKSDLGDIHSIRVWHNNEGRMPSWYLSRIKVENLFSRYIWLFICRKWLSVDTSLDRTFHVTHPDEPLSRKDFFLIDVVSMLGESHMWFSIFASIVDKPFNRLQRLSCCLALLLSTLLCNIMFFNLNREQETEFNRAHYIRSMVIGIESALITVPVQVIVSFLFIYSQKKPPQVSLDEVSPKKHPPMAEPSVPWEERLEKWYAHETSQAPASKAGKLSSRENPGLPEASVKAAFKTQSKLEKAQTRAPQTHRAVTNSNNNNIRDAQDMPSEAPPPQQEPEPPEPKPVILLPWWCVYIAWFLVFAISSISSFFIVFYGLTYGYGKSIEWLFASFCSFCQSIFLLQPLKIILQSGFRTQQPKYCKNLSWTTKYHYAELKLHGMRRDPSEMQALHQHIAQVRSSRMYQPLTEDEIRIFQRKKRIKRRAGLFLSYLLTHFIFLALLLTFGTLLHSTNSFYYNQFIRDQFSVELTTVTRLEHIYRWLNRVLLPLFHNNLNPTFLLDSSSKILGLPLMRQIRAKPGKKACLPAKMLVPDSIRKEIHCHPKYGIDPEDTKSYSSSWNDVNKRAVRKDTNGFTYKPREKKWVYHSYGLFHTYGSGGYAFYFFPEQQQFNSTLRLRELQGNNWLDEKTWAVILELTTFNPDANLFCSISVIFEASQLGIVNTSISVHSFSLPEFNQKTSVEIYVYLAILIFFVAYIVDEGYIILQERASYLRSVYNLLNFALKCIFTVLIVLFFWKHFLTTGVIQFYLSSPEDFIPFHAVSHVDHIMRIILGFLLFLTILKTLRYSRFFYDVRLAQRAIRTALPGIYHVALVVAVCFFVYMAFGHLMFGQHEWNYSNMIHATQTIFSYCVLAFQNTTFSSNRVLGVLFLSSFMLVMICILINLFRAVILSSYEEMKQPVYEEPSDEVEAITYLCRKLRTVFRCLTCQSRAKDEPEFFTDMLYGQPEKKSHRYLGLKTRNINGKKMVYLVV
ncbi:polycystic kidney disease and receptor for egg jelly-related protein [Choloepus didactylus]|uniref:polycystic kidney disease and receptor for egg jelly-related protein n=1 Tax=Choloepus didactylus TaxID=27675 RepID=UPI00189DD877|nr:polycystic kidney disease and receptor for egg jelly-related protein [Choloepus didactylus]